MAAYIHSFGTYIPPREISNEELSQFPPASLARIKIKTGVEKRRFSDGGLSSDLAVRAAADCLSKNPFPRDSVDTVILATSTPDRMIPATAALVSEKLNIKNAFAFDINSVCSGGLAALMLAASLVESGAAANVLVIAADVYSRILNPRDFSTYPYFGDGAAALIVSREKSGIKIGRSLFRSDGSGYGVITVKADAAEIRPVDLKTPSDSYFSMNGREVFDFAVSRVPEVILHLMDRDGISMGEVRQFILHQANRENIGRYRERHFNVFYQLAKIRQYGGRFVPCGVVGIFGFFAGNQRRIYNTFEFRGRVVMGGFVARNIRQMPWIIFIVKIKSSFLTT